MYWPESARPVADWRRRPLWAELSAAARRDRGATAKGCPCQDLFGRNAHAEGGIFGRTGVGFTSVEAQKPTGSLHAHTLLWVQRLHQRTPLADIFLKAKDSAKDLVAKYLRYKRHASHQIYAHKPTEKELEMMEAAWPEYKDTHELMCRPAYLPARASDSHGDAAQWVNSYLCEDVNLLQLRKKECLTAVTELCVYLLALHY